MHTLGNAVLLSIMLVGCATTDQHRPLPEDYGLVRNHEHVRERIAEYVDVNSCHRSVYELYTPLEALVEENSIEPIFSSHCLSDGDSLVLVVSYTLAGEVKWQELRFPVLGV